MKALIAMSGGVDSSVAAYLMKSGGYDCIGCTMKLYTNEDIDAPEGKTCCSLDDVEDARSVAFRLGIPYYVFNFKDRFKEKVIDRFISSYESGQTPNPCIDCNRFLKFDGLYDRAKELGCDYIVTGHYARIEFDDITGKYMLKKAKDPSKDQSYVLYFLNQEQLAHTRFPLGSMSKSETRKIADNNGFVNASKPDSQDICFVPDGDYVSFMEKYTGKIYPPGNYIDDSGNIIGTHKGYVHYTIGQRKGLGVAFGEPRFVSKIDPVNNTVTLTKEDALFTNTVNVSDMNWISGEAPLNPIKCKAKIRYRHKETDCTVYPEGNRAKIVFDEPVRAVTPGQAAVLYDGDVVLGGGIIIQGGEDK